MLNKSSPFFLPLKLTRPASPLSLPHLISHPLYFPNHLNIYPDPRQYKGWTPSPTFLLMTHPKSCLPNGVLVFVSDCVQGHPQPCITMPVLTLLPLCPRPTSHSLFKAKPEEKRGICPQQSANQSCFSNICKASIQQSRIHETSSLSIYQVNLQFSEDIQNFQPLTKDRLGLSPH